MIKRYPHLLIWVAAGLSSPVLAQPAGPEFRVNTYTRREQARPSVAADANGNFVVAWHSKRQAPDGSGYGAKVRRFTSGGHSLGPEFQVNTYYTSDQVQPSVASDARGNFVVVWQSFRQDGDSYGVFGQRYDDSGNPSGGEFQVSTQTMGSQSQPAVASDATGNQDYPSVASDATGNVVVVWESDGQEGPGQREGVFGQRYDFSGNRIGREFRVNTYTTGGQLAPSVASDASGNFVVVWASPQDGGGGFEGAFGIFGQRYDSDGRLGGEFQVNSYTSHWQRNASVASDPNGNFVVVWESYRQYRVQTPGLADGPSEARFDIFGKRFSAGCGSTASMPTLLCPGTPR